MEEHLLHLQQFFQVCQDNGLTINPAKCVFAASSLKFLGHMVSESGVTPLPRHVAAVQDCPPPTDIKQLQRFLGLINFYRRFLPAIARTLQPLTDLLKGSPKTLLWSTAAAKAALVAAVPLCHPAPHAALSLAVDASDTHVPAAVVPLPPPVRLRSCIANKGSMSASKRSRHVSFTLPTTTATFPSATSSPPPSPSPEEDHLRRSARPTTRPARYSR
jgi:hypothetical protein